ncbi:MAG: LuxR C-terminal-related transcriptional regulator [Nocardioides sp.]
MAQRWDQWLDLVSSLAAHPCPTFPREPVGRQLADSFQSRTSWRWVEGDGFGFAMDEPSPDWPTEEDYRRWACEGFREPTLCFYRQAEPPEPTSCPDAVPTVSSRAVVLTPSAEEPGDEDHTLARLIQPLLALLAHQAALLDGVGCPEAAGIGLTGREAVVLRLLSEGRTAVSIAHALEVSPRTVHTHLSHIYRKLGVCDRMRAVLVARELGVLNPPP